MGQYLSYIIRQDAPVMNMKSIRRILWNTKHRARPVYEQLELQLPASRLTRSDVELLEGLRRIRENLDRN